jgi:hypothetical protein
MYFQQSHPALGERVFHRQVEGEPIPNIMPLRYLLTVIYLVRQASQLGRPRESRKWRM